MTTLRSILACSLTLQFEGDTLSDDPVDPGGASRFGLTQRFLQDTIGPHSITPAELTINDAMAIYEAHVWTPLRGDEFPQEAVARKTFDMAVNMGQGTAVRLLQAALNRVLRGTVPVLAVDGVLGTQTLAAMARPGATSDAVLGQLISQCHDHYGALVEANSALAKFLPGWTRRANYRGEWQ